MCRLLGVVAATTAPIADLVRDELPRLEALAAVHPHGWGIASVGDSVRIEVRKVPERAATSHRWTQAVRASADIALLHIRQASPGMPHVDANTHPFVADGMAFAHNGHAHPTAALDALVESVGGPRAAGDTDSERYFALVRAAARNDAVDRSLLHAAERITASARATSLNALSLTDRALTAIAWWDEPVIRTAGDGETDRDYRLWYRLSPDRVVVASAVVAGDGPEWQELPHGHTLCIDRHTLAVRIDSVLGRRHVA
ncbi:MAG: class II glutamine amidotransferase [Candidatus Limnocylindrales bacterium]